MMMYHCHESSQEWKTLALIARTETIRISQCPFHHELPSVVFCI
jgi:hypothetical protein